MLLDCERTRRSPVYQSVVVAWNRGLGQERPRLRTSIISWRLRTGGLRAAMAPRPIDWIVATLPSRAAWRAHARAPDWGWTRSSVSNAPVVLDTVQKDRYRRATARDDRPPRSRRSLRPRCRQ